MENHCRLVRMRKSVAAIVLAIGAPAGLPAQGPVDVTRLGPQVGATVTDFALTDQFGKPHRLSTSADQKGTMLVFFRSADW